jgi:hypothetical protein
VPLTFFFLKKGKNLIENFGNIDKNQEDLNYFLFAQLLKNVEFNQKSSLLTICIVTCDFTVL